MTDMWQERKRPVRLERRYEFPNYSELRDFLDEAAELSEARGYYPDMGFGTQYVNVTIHLDEDNDEITPEQRQFAKELDKLITLTDSI
tara:strand:+ start:11972 stop:12235 length:264 start_codon:yes stop_codon:yes gene_type:complete